MIIEAIGDQSLKAQNRESEVRSCEIATSKESVLNQILN